MKSLFLTTTLITLALASPIAPPAPTTDAAPTTATSTTTPEPATAASSTAEQTHSSEPNLDNLCIGVHIADGETTNLPPGGDGELLSLGKLVECASNTLNDKPITKLLGRLSLLGGGGK
ncbi:hypothetical protein BJX70DRAFT_357647 [Aspergillus crustosus]